MSSKELVSIHPMLPLIFPVTEPINGIKDQIDPDAAWHFYSHSIRRNPNDLKLHTRRIFFAMQHRNAELLPGSLHDLFFVLKDAGENLRIRLLKASAPYLTKKDITYFAMWIKVGIKKGMGYKWIPGAVLSCGLYGPDQTLLEMMPQENLQASLSPIEEARACMEYGQLEVAQRILEEALEKDSQNKILIEELEYLSKYTKSKQIQPPKAAPQNIMKNTFGRIKEAIFH